MSARLLLALSALALTACPGEIDDLARFLDAAADARRDDARVEPDAPPAADVPPTLDVVADAPVGCALDVERDIFVARCGVEGCHTRAEPVASLDLASPGQAARLVNVRSRCRSMPLVVRGDPEGSFLYQKIVQPRPTCGEQMPSDFLLTAAQVACVRAWITDLRPDAGAPADASRDGGG